MKKITAILPILALGPCGQPTDKNRSATTMLFKQTAEPPVSMYAMAAANTARPEADRARDAGRELE